MALDPDQLVVPGSGHVYTGTPGVSTVPTNISAAIDIAGVDGWVELGYTSEDGVGFKFGKETKPIMGWQTRRTLRNIVTGTPTSFGFTLLQQNAATFRLAMGGGSWTGSSPNFQFAPAPAQATDERSFIIESYDGDYTYRFIFREASLSEDVEFDWKADEPFDLPVRFEVLESDLHENPWIFQTNDPELGQFALVGT